MSYSKHVLIAASMASFAFAQNQGQSPSKSQTEGQKQSQSQTQTDSQSQRDRSSSTSSSSSTSTSNANNRLSTAETRFVQEAMESGKHEVEMARMALSQASDSKVKSFAQRLVNDHTAANRKLEDIAKKNGISTASSGEASRSTTSDARTGNTSDRSTSTSKSQTESDRTGNTQKSTSSSSTSTGAADSQSEQLAGLRGAEFDREFMKQMVQNHQSGVSKYEAAQKEAMNSDLKSYISSTLPTLREHLKQAQSIDSSTNNKANSNTRN